MNSAILEITLQHQRNGVWPVVAEYWQSQEDLPTRAEGTLQLDVPSLENILDRQQYGRELGKALFAGDIRELLNEQQMRVLLVVEDDALRSIHWERLQLPLRGQRWLPLCRSQQFLFSRYLPSLSSRLFGQVGTRELRALVLVANPVESNEHGLARFDAGCFVDGTRRALEGVPCDVLGNVPGAMAEPSLKALCRALTSHRYSILHIVAHGWVNRSKENIIYLTGPGDDVEAVKATRLVEELGNISALPPFVFLASCESADPAAEVGKGVLARRLVRELGIPAVVAMTERVGIDTAQRLTRVFYEHLRQDGMLDRALAAAAIEIAEEDDATVPALFSRLRGRPLFFDRTGRALSKEEQEHGLKEMEQWFARRAPVLMDELRQHEHTARLQGAPDSWIEEYCERVLDFDFDSLARGKQPPVPDAEPVCPFPGLRAFQENDKHFFFGREQRVKNLLRKMELSNFLAVLGNSGTGKSSLVLAGLIPELRKRQSDLTVAYMKPGSSPMATLEKLVAVIAPGTLLVVDQFEEAFTQCNSAAERTDFFHRLLELSKTYRTVISMRADFWGECAPHTALVEAMQANQELVPGMTGAEMRSAMEQQVAAVGLRFEADVSRTVLEDVTGEPGAMPLLQHALRELWNRRHGAWLRADEYSAMGGIRQAIARTADGFFEERDDRGQELVRHVFTRLTRIDVESEVAEGRRDTRQRITWEELVPVRENRDDVVRLVHELADARLVTVSAAGAREEVEVAHEALIQYWPRLRRWLDEDQAMLRQREILRREAKQWEENGHDPSYLLHGKRLEAIEAASRMPRFEISELESAYLKACCGKRAQTEQLGVNIRLTKDALEISSAPLGVDPDFFLDPSELQRLNGDPAGYRSYLNAAFPTGGTEADLRFEILEVDPALADVRWEALSCCSQNAVRFRENRNIHLRPKRELRAMILSQDEGESEFVRQSLLGVNTVAESDGSADIVYLAENFTVEAALVIGKLAVTPKLVVLRGADSRLAIELIQIGVAGVLSISQVSVETFRGALAAFFDQLLKGDGAAGPAIAAARNAVAERPDRFMLAMFVGLKGGWLWYQKGCAVPSVMKGCRDATIVCGPALMDPLIGSVRWLVDSLAGRLLSWRNVDVSDLGLRECLELISQGEQRDFVIDELREAIWHRMHTHGDNAPLAKALLDRVFENLTKPNGSVYRMLSDLNARLYIDTNPIPLVHSILQAAGKEPELVEIEWRDSYGKTSQDDLDRSKVIVVQLFGDIRNSKQLVINQEDHLEHLTACRTLRLLPASVLDGVVNRATVFVGFSHTDPAFQYFDPLFACNMTRRSLRMIQIAGMQGADPLALRYCDRHGLQLYRGECEDILGDLLQNVNPKQARSL